MSGTSRVKLEGKALEAEILKELEINLDAKMAELEKAGAFLNASELKQLALFCQGNVGKCENVASLKSAEQRVGWIVALIKKNPDDPNARAILNCYVNASRLNFIDRKMSVFLDDVSQSCINGKLTQEELLFVEYFNSIMSYPSYDTASIISRDKALTLFLLDLEEYQKQKSKEAAQQRQPLVLEQKANSSLAPGFQLFKLVTDPKFLEIKVENKKATQKPPLIFLAEKYATKLTIGREYSHQADKGDVLKCPGDVELFFKILKSDEYKDENSFGAQLLRYYHVAVEQNRKRPYSFEPLADIWREEKDPDIRNIAGVYLRLDVSEVYIIEVVEFFRKNRDKCRVLINYFNEILGHYKKAENQSEKEIAERMLRLFFNDCYALRNNSILLEEATERVLIPSSALFRFKTDKDLTGAQNKQSQLYKSLLQKYQKQIQNNAKDSKHNLTYPLFKDLFLIREILLSGECKNENSVGMLLLQCYEKCDLLDRDPMIASDQITMISAIWKNTAVWPQAQVCLKLYLDMHERVYRDPNPWYYFELLESLFGKLKKLAQSNQSNDGGEHKRSLPPSDGRVALDSQQASSLRKLDGDVGFLEKFSQFMRNYGKLSTEYKANIASSHHFKKLCTLLPTKFLIKINELQDDGFESLCKLLPPDGQRSQLDPKAWFEAYQSLSKDPALKGHKDPVLEEKKDSAPNDDKDSVLKENKSAAPKDNNDSTFKASIAWKKNLIKFFINRQLPELHEALNKQCDLLNDDDQCLDFVKSISKLECINEYANHHDEFNVVNDELVNSIINDTADSLRIASEMDDFITAADNEKANAYLKLLSSAKKDLENQGSPRARFWGAFFKWAGVALGVVALILLGAHFAPFIVNAVSQDTLNMFTTSGTISLIVAALSSFGGWVSEKCGQSALAKQTLGWLSKNGYDQYDNRGYCARLFGRFPKPVAKEEARVDKARVSTLRDA